ncbi:hypothetical protein BCD67_10815 [Oscillatoriales cyanobacterium USR001]|nr:hypothetical protein BCD67_10815 [Oscillatoriales cyanobacterium USR001]
MRNRQHTEIKGSCAQMWGNVLVPTNGTITVKIDGDNLRATTQSGLEKKESWTRIQNIDSIEIHSAPVYLLLVLGVSIGMSGLGNFVATLSNGSSPIFAFFLLLLGIALIVISIIKKQRYVAIYSLRYTIPLFMKGSPETYQQFAIQVIALADKLNQSN